MDFNLLIILIIFALLLSLAFMPYWTRKTENFGVSIPEDEYFRADFKKLRFQYTRNLVGIHLILSVMLIVLSKYLVEDKLFIAFIVLLTLYLLLSFLLYLPPHFQMKRVKEKENWFSDQKQITMIDTSFHAEKTTLSSFWFSIPFLIVVATTTYTFFVYDAIPNKIPMHTSFSGHVTYDDKTVGNLLIMPAMQVFMLFIFIMINYIIKNAKQQVDVKNPERSKVQNMHFRKRWSGFIIIMSVLMSILFTFIQFTFIYPALLPYSDAVIITFLAIILIGVIYLSVRTGQGGSRIKVEANNQPNVIERDEDRHWKLGQFYVNKNDPAIFIEKRFGIGWTNNWAHPISWILLVTIIGMPLIIVWLLTR